MKSTFAVVWNFQLRHTLRNRWLLLYGAGLFALTGVLFRFGGVAEQVVVSLLNVVLLLVPLISLLYGVLGMSHAREFLELMLAQPLRRQELFWGTFVGMVLPLVLVLPIGVGIPWALLAAQRWELYLTLALGSMALTVIGFGFGATFALWWEERLRAFGMAIVAWLLAALLFDGIALLLGIVLHEYAIERGLILLLLLNPIDLVRTVVLLQLDTAALLGYTGALLRHLVGGGLGLVVAAGALLGWIALPILLALRSFVRKDF